MSEQPPATPERSPAPGRRVGTPEPTHAELPATARAPQRSTTPEPPSPPPGDAGVAARVRNRTAGAAAGLLVLAGILAILGWVWPGGLIGVTGAVIGAVVVTVPLVGAAVLVRRAGLWARAVRLAARISADPVTVAGLSAVCGPPVPLHPVRPGTPPIRTGRRLRASVVPVRAVTGPLSGGRALLVHARPDNLLPRPEDSIEVHALGSRGPFLLCRSPDGVVFAADCWTLSTV